MAKQPLTDHHRATSINYTSLEKKVIAGILMQGYTAAETGKQRDENPYSPTSDSWTLWDKGWEDCDTRYREELQSVSYTTTIGTAMVVGATIGIALWLLFTS